MILEMDGEIKEMDSCTTISTTQSSNDALKIEKKKERRQGF